MCPILRQLTLPWTSLMGNRPACRVVVVDDSNLIRRRLLAMLNQLDGVEVVGEAADAKMARDLVRALSPNVVILDIMMPRGNGIDLLEEIKRSHPSTIVVVLTNYPYPAFRRRCAELGAEFFLHKATESHQLVHILQNREAGEELT